jgi:ACT domain
VSIFSQSILQHKYRLSFSHPLVVAALTLTLITELTTVDTTGVAGRFFSALGTAGINILAIAQGCSERVSDAPYVQYRILCLQCSVLLV